MIKYSKSLELPDDCFASIYLDDWDKTTPTFYLDSDRGYSFADLQTIITTYWPGCDLTKIQITSCSEKMRGCGCHPEPSDYDTFLQIALPT